MRLIPLSCSNAACCAGRQHLQHLQHLLHWGHVAGMSQFASTLLINPHKPSQGKLAGNKCSCKKTVLPCGLILSIKPVAKRFHRAQCSGLCQTRQPRLTLHSCAKSVPGRNEQDRSGQRFITASHNLYELDLSVHHLPTWRLVRTLLHFAHRTNDAKRCRGETVA